MDFKAINTIAVKSIYHILANWLPGGKQQGNEYVVLNPTRQDRHAGSFKINTLSGMWSDFSTNDKGGDLISLISYVDKITQREAANRIQACLGMSFKKDVTHVTPVTLEKSSIKSKALPVTKAPQPAPPNYVTTVTGEEIFEPLIPVPDDAPPPPQEHSRWGKVSHQYVYRTAEGKVAFYLYRFERIENGKPSKAFSPLIYSQSNQGKQSWQWKSPPAPRLLYNLDQITHNKTKIVVFFEGEKSADAGATLFPDFIATTTMHGSKSPHKSDLGCLKGRDILIWPDNDESGKQYAQALANLLAKAGADSTHILNLEKFQFLPGTNENGDPILDHKRPLPDKWDAADAVTEGYTAAHLQLILNDDDCLIELGAEGEITAPNDQTKKTRPYYTSDKKNGVLFHGLDKQGNPLAPIRVCSHLEVTALTRNQSSENWGRLLEFDDRDGVHHQFALPMEMMSGDGNEYRKELFRLGLDIGCGRANHYRLDNYINNADPKARAICTDRIGWHHSAFILPNQTIGNNPEKVIFQATQSLQHHFTQLGTLEGWQDKIARYCVGNSRLIFAISAALAAPLLYLLGEESGGFNFVGPSSCGKTTALKVAASVWGSPSFVQRWRATANGLEGIAYLHNDTLLILDELAQIDPKDAGDVAYMLANGQGKVRAQKNGFAKTSMNWRLLFLSAGEVGLAEHMREANKRSKAGQEVRLTDIPADPGKALGIFETLHEFNSGAELSQALVHGAAEAYGTAGIAWLEVLTEIVTNRNKIDYLKKLQRKFMDEILPTDASSQVQRVGARMGLIAAAGEYATSSGITGWPSYAPSESAKACFMSWLEQRGGSENQEITQILSHIRAFFEAHGESHFSSLDELEPSYIITRDRVGFRRRVNDEIEYLVLAEAYGNRICKGFNKQFVTNLLLEKGWIKPDLNNKPYHTNRLPKLGTTRYYVFTNRIWE